MAGRLSPWYHERLTTRVARQLAREGHEEVRTNARGWLRPESIRGPGLRSRHVPDVTAVRQGRLRVFEVETLDSLHDRHTLAHWEAFSSFASRSGAEFCVVVPKGLKGTAESAVREFHLEATVMEASILP